MHQHPHQCKISQLHRAVVEGVHARSGGNQEVFGLQVTVHDAAFVAIGYGGQQLGHNVLCLDKERIVSVREAIWPYR